MTITPATSGTTNYAATTAEVVLEAYERCMIRSAELTTDHMVSARRSLNILLTSEWANRTPNLWTVDLYSIYLAQGLATYSLPANTVAILDVYIRLNAGQSNQTDIVLYPISRTDYSATPNKTYQSQPTVFWFNRQETPNITFWQTPDNNGPYIVNCYRLRQLQDNSVSIAELPDVPTRFTEALCADLAVKLAVKWAPERLAVLAPLAAQARKDAEREDRERVTMYAGPDLTHYWRRW